MSKGNVVDASLLRELLHYDPETGKLYWKTRSEAMFAHTTHPEGRCRSWNSKFSGKEALTADSGIGYRTGSIFDRDVYAHRVAWEWMTGESPDQIDHINGDRSDNRFENLRNVCAAENLKNSAMKRNNTSGITGVRWDAERNKWFAYIRCNGKMRSLGRHADLEAAVAARLGAEREFGYHEGHGKRAAAY